MVLSAFLFKNTALWHLKRRINFLFSKSPQPVPCEGSSCHPYIFSAEIFYHYGYQRMESVMYDTERMFKGYRGTAK
jgi:hypothetical protein